MANSVSNQILIDGPKNFVMKVTGYLDTSNLTQAVLVDPSTLNYPPGRLSLEEIVFAVQDGLEVNLLWDATVPVQLETLIGRGKKDKMYRYAGVWNNAGAGVTGKILYSTLGWTTGNILSFDFTMTCVKRQTQY